MKIACEGFYILDWHWFAFLVGDSDAL